MQADITAVIGSTGTGKTHWMLAELTRRKPPRLFIWDPEGEFAAHGACTGQARELVQLSAGDRFAIVFNPPFDRELGERAFSLFCKVAFERGCCTVLIDELADVVRAGSAPEGWTQLVRRGRKREVSILAASQRPASIDKTFWSLASRVRCTRLAYLEDQRAMAAALGAELGQVQALQGFEAIDIDRNQPATVAERGSRVGRVGVSGSVAAATRSVGRPKRR